MSYQTMEWVDNSDGGTPISADNLNNMVAGIDEALEDITLSRIASSVYTDTPAYGNPKLMTANGVFNALSGKLGYEDLGSKTKAQFDELNLTVGKLYFATFAADFFFSGSTRRYGYCLAFSAVLRFFILQDAFYQCVKYGSTWGGCVPAIVGKSLRDNTITYDKLATALHAKIDTESGTVSSAALYINDSTKTISGTYSLHGDFCTVTAAADTVDGASSISYSAPVTALASSAIIGTGNSTNGAYMVVVNNSTISIYPLTGSTLSGESVSFTIRYKYK